MNCSNPTAPASTGHTVIKRLLNKALITVCSTLCRVPSPLHDPLNEGTSTGSKWHGQFNQLGRHVGTLYIHITRAFLGVPSAQHGERIKKIRNGPREGKMATQPLPSEGPQCPAQGQNQKWLTWGQDGYSPVLSQGPKYEKIGYIPPAFLGFLVLRTGRKSAAAQIWAKWLHHLSSWGFPRELNMGRKAAMACVWARWLSLIGCNSREAGSN